MIITVIRLGCPLLLGPSLGLGKLDTVDGEALGAIVNAGAANDTDSNIKNSDNNNNNRAFKSQTSWVRLELKPTETIKVQIRE